MAAEAPVPSTSSPDRLQPSRPGLVALAVFVAASLTLCWPVLVGAFLPGSDQYLSGYAFRHFAAEYWREHHAIPLWNPYIFAGMPYVGGMHGDIFYPTAWLRWILPTGTAMGLGFALHFVVAGAGMYAFLRGLRLSWGAAVVGGLAFELSGIVASLISPGHDGKLFTTALAPLLFLALLRAVRAPRVDRFALVALVIGLSLHGHPQLSYYLLVAAGLWTLFLVFGDPERSRNTPRWVPLAAALGAVLLGAGLYTIQGVPFYEYIPYSPRAGGASSAGWEYMTAYSMPIDELMSTFLPQFNGIKDLYWGQNGFKLHTEYIGVSVLVLAGLGLGGKDQRHIRWAVAAIGMFFLLISLGSHTPFYRVWYELMPGMNKVRAPGSAFFLVALPVCVFAGFGADRVLAASANRSRLLIGAGIFAALGALGAVGALQGITEGLAAGSGRIDAALANAGELRLGSVRLLLFAALAGGVFLAVGARRLRGLVAVAAMGAVVLADLWSIDRRFVEIEGESAELFQDDAITRRIKEAPMPYRVWQPAGGQISALAPYPGSWLMGVHVPTLFGYHGNELHAFDELLGGKNLWQNQLSPVMLDLFAIRYVLLRQEQELPRYHKILEGKTTVGSDAVLYEADTVPPYVRLMAGAIKVPREQIPGIVNDPRFPALAVALYDDSSTVSPVDLGNDPPAPATARAQVTEWEPGRMAVAIEGQDTRELYLVVSENWYKDWRATVDGRPVVPLAAHSTLLSVPIPPGAKEVRFEVRSDAYRLGRLLTLLSALVVVGLLVAPRLTARRTADG
jgi:hypothetical protein